MVRVPGLQAASARGARSQNALARARPSRSGRATRAGAKYLINNVALAVAPKGVTVNGMGTNFCDYPGFRDSVNCHTDEELAEWASFIPQRRLGPPEEIAYLAASLLDGKCNYFAAQFACMSGGWNGL